MNGKETAKDQQTEESKLEIRTDGGNCQEKKPKPRKTMISEKLTEFKRVIRRYKKQYQNGKTPKMETDMDKQEKPSKSIVTIKEVPTTNLHTKGQTDMN